MPSQLWGTYSVADHCGAYPFIADLVLYDRLLVPVPPEGDEEEWKRWDHKRWRPERQRLLLCELGDYVRKVPWTKDLRERWDQLGRDEEEDTAALAGRDLAMTADSARERAAGRVDPYGDTRLVIARELGADLLEGSDARVLSVYGSPDRFDRHWRITKAFPFLTRKTTVARTQADFDVEALNREEQEELARHHQHATVIVGQFVLPVEPPEKPEPDDKVDRDVLARAVELLEDETIAPKRRALHAWVAAYEDKKLPTPRKVKEFEELLTAYNAAVRAKKRLVWTDTALVALRTVADGASFVVPGTQAVGPVTSVIGTVATRWAGPSEWQPGDIRGAALVEEAQRQVRGAFSSRKHHAE